MRSICVLAMALVLAGCDGHDNRGDDGYLFGAKEWQHDHMTITLVVHPSIENLRRAAPVAVAQPEGRELMAWSVLRGDACEIHVVDPAVDYAPQWIGHEFAHCAWGRWHA